MGSASGVVGMQKCWEDARRRFAHSTPGVRVVDALRRSGLDFYGHILLWPPKYAHEWAVQVAWLGCTNVGGVPRSRFAPCTPCGRVADAHRRRGLDFHGHIRLWPPKYAHEWAVQVA